MGKQWKKISELASLVNGEWQGEIDVAIYEMADLNTAEEGQIAYLDSKRKAQEALETGAAALIVPRDMEDLPVPVVKVDNPAWAAAVIHTHLLRKEFVASGIDGRAVIGLDCSISEDVSIEPLVVVGDRVKVGHRTQIKPGVVIGNDVVIGDDVLLYPNVTILDGSVLGNRIIIHSGTVIGSDGFGYAHDSQGHHVKRPHVGYVQIDDDVEIGANVCVDRATFGRTWIKRGTKIDNLVQVAHNVEIGEDTIIAGQSGIAGSTVVGKGLVVGGHSAISGHLNLGDRVTVAGHSAVINNQDDGVVVAGFPAFPHKQWLRASAAFQRLPGLVKEIREIKNKLAAIEKNIGE